jgi:diaminopimelate epimerase
MPAISGRGFVKMSGSGNDFVMVDARTEPPGELAEPRVVAEVCARATGVGADGIVFLLPSIRADLRLVYLNSDGSLADLCGNATLCTTQLAVRLGAADPAGLVIETGAGLVQARILASGNPEIDLDEVTDVRPTFGSIALAGPERRIGFATAGIPHLVIEVADVSLVDVVGRGRPLRWDKSLPNGANVNFVSTQDAGVGGTPWSIRTYERGVEGETLACGTGAVAAGVLLSVWHGDAGAMHLTTKSGRELTVRLKRTSTGWLPSLSGEARVVFDGRFGDI